MNPELLKTFLAVYRRRSFTQAAEIVGRTQPAVSRQIRQLEKELSVDLFERLGKSVIPTDAGRVLAPLAEQMLGQIERIAETVRGYAGAGRGLLRIGASTTPGYYWLPQFLGKFHSRYPEVEVSLTVANSRTIEQLIHGNELDLGFIGGHLTSDALSLERIAEDSLIGICGPSHATGRLRLPTRDVLSRATWIIREKGSATRQLIEEALVRIRVKPQRVIELDSPEGIKALVSAGLGISVLSIHAVARELRRRELRRVRIQGLPVSRPLFLVRHPDKHTSALMQNLLDLLPKG